MYAIKSENCQFVLLTHSVFCIIYISSPLASFLNTLTIIIHCTSLEIIPRKIDVIKRLTLYKLNAYKTLVFVNQIKTSIVDYHQYNLIHLINNYSRINFQIIFIIKLCYIISYCKANMRVVLQYLLDSN